MLRALLAGQVTIAHGPMTIQDRTVAEAPIDVVNYFANRTSPDTIYKPAESVRSVSVGALNPPKTG
jgi:hypothetical protein